MQNKFSLFYPGPLKGSFKLADSANFSFENWFSGDFQIKQERFIEDHIGFREDLVRLNNQLDYSLFDKGNADGVILGKEGYLFEEGYLDAYLGRDFVGKEFIDDQLYKAKYLQDTLKKLNISLILAYAPGKATFCSEFIPDRYLKYKRPITNYEYYARKSNELGLNVLDLASYFSKMKDTSRFLLFPKCSIHWSNYGFILAADSTIHYIERLRNIDMVDVICERIEFPDDLRNTDYDIGDGLNLIWHIPFNKMAYPVIKFVNGPNKSKPNVLTIADSYYKSFYYYAVPENLFNQNGFWYYNKEIQHDGTGIEKKVSDLDLKAQIEKQQVIMLMATEKNMWRYSFRFIDNAFEIYGPKTILEKQKYYKSIINTDKELLTVLEVKAANEKKDVSEIINREADRQIKLEKEKMKSLREIRIRFYINQIKTTPSLFNMVKEKIKGTKVSLEEGILTDAKWLYNNENPDPMQRLLDIEESIRSNKELMQTEVEKAKAHNLSIDDMIKSDAKWIFEDERRKKK